MLKVLTCLVAAAALSGCASMNRLSNEVSSYGAWPAERKAASFVFDRLPSQNEQPEMQRLLEDAARPALEAAGFKQASELSAASYMVQLGARVTTDDRWFYDDGFGGFVGLNGWRGFYRHPRAGYGWGYGWGVGQGPYPQRQYQREVMLLVRDRQSGQTVYETRARNAGYSSSIDALAPAMFEAAMKDFPNAGLNPRRVMTQIGPDRGAPAR